MKSLYRLVFGAALWSLCLRSSPSSAQVWTPTTAPPAFWQAVASSADGTQLVATTDDAAIIYTSTDSGNTWTAQAGGLSYWATYWASVASSADGTKLVAALHEEVISGTTYAGQILLSTDSGTNWTVSSASGAYWSSVASSADGSALVAVSRESELISTSVDSGNTWTPVSGLSAQIWQGVASHKH